jgi:hypothetical protein
MTTPSCCRTGCIGTSAVRTSTHWLTRTLRFGRPSTQLAGSLETTPPEVFALDYQERLAAARLHIAPQIASWSKSRPRQRFAVVERSQASVDSEVAGWVFEEAVVEVLRHVAVYVGYRYRALDEQALVGALEQTNEDDDRWWEYPISGTPALVVRLARSVGTPVVIVRIAGPMDAVLATRIETVLEVLSGARVADAP